MKNLHFIILILVFNCCGKNEKTDNYYPKTTIEEIEILKENIIEKGDIKSYNTLYVEYMYTEHFEELLIYSIIMANDYNYSQAHYDAFKGIYLLYKNRRDKINEKSAEIALNYLRSAAALKHHQALDDIKYYSISDTSNAILVMNQMFMED